MHPNILQPEKTAFVIVDVQTAFRASISDFDYIAKRIAVFAEGAKLLGMPIIVTEQYPKGLGRTATEILNVLPDNAEIIEKTAFSSCGVLAFGERLLNTGATQIIVAGLETHVCVNQTVHDLLDGGFQLHLLHDCIASRSEINKQIGMNKMQLSGAISSSVETALFELMRDARHEQFKAIQKLIK